MDNQNQNPNSPEILELEELMAQEDEKEIPVEEKEIADETELANRLPIRKETKEKEEDEEEKEIKLEGEDEEKDEDELEIIAPVKRKEILAKYPNVFKDFPYLERAYFREQKFTEIFPTIDDAKNAHEELELLNQVREKVVEGDLSPILSELHGDKEAFAKAVDNYLPSLANVSKDAYFHVVGNIIKQSVQSMFNEGQRLQNEDLQKAAVVLNQFVFGTSQYTPPTNLSSGEKKDDSVSKERESFIREKFEYHRGDLQTKIQNTLTATIDSHIDPKGTMSPYVRKKAVEDCLNQLMDSVGNDSRFKSINDKLWEQAFKNDFNRGDLDKIRSVYLSRAKTLLPELIKRIRNEALRGQSSRVVKDDEAPIERGRNTAPKLERSTEKKEIGRREKTLDFFMRD